ncbi:DNA alkylation repair protein [Candidatus Berkelbacteria bacterium]|nr:DNA alkylation repair protein [Candidatus Berkelbacteria bacterium]
MTKLTAQGVKISLKAKASPEKAKASAWFFKTGKGQYGENDKFNGVTVPEQRKVARAFRDLPLKEIAKLLESSIHEHRLTALLILVRQYQGDGEVERAKLVKFYLVHLDGVNNWDLVDSSAPYILGDWLIRHPKERLTLKKLAATKNLWRERVAIVASGALIKSGQFAETLALAKQFLTHSHDLIHKATGWMLREVGKRDKTTLTRFLDDHAPTMPRTMLRYAIEKLSKEERLRYLKAS